MLREPQLSSGMIGLETRMICLGLGLVKLLILISCMSVPWSPIIDYKLRTHIHKNLTISMALISLTVRYGDGAGNTVAENSSVFSIIRMR